MSRQGQLRQLQNRVNDVLSRLIEQTGDGVEGPDSANFTEQLSGVATTCQTNWQAIFFRANKKNLVTV